MIFALPIVLDLKEKQNQFDIATLNSFLDIFLTNKSGGHRGSRFMDFSFFPKFEFFFPIK